MRFDFESKLLWNKNIFYKQADQNPGDESPDMGQVSDSSPQVICREVGHDNLFQKPETDPGPRRNVENVEEDKDPEEHLDPMGGKEDNISGERSRDRSGSPDGGDQ